MMNECGVTENVEFNIAWGATFGITDKMEAWTQPPSPHLAGMVPGYRS